MPRFAGGYSTMTSRPLIFTSQNVILPDYDRPVPASIKVDRSTGKIIEIVTSGTSLPEDGLAELVDVGSKYILPGLVECVTFMRS